MIRLRSEGLGKKDHRGKALFSSFQRYPLSTRLMFVDVNPHCLAEVVSIRFSHCNITLFFPLSILCFFRRKSLKMSGLCATSLLVEYLCQLCGVLLHLRFVSKPQKNPPFFYLFTHLSVCTHRYLLYTLGYNQIPHH